jgi:hypothetical protein
MISKFKSILMQALVHFTCLCIYSFDNDTIFLNKINRLVFIYLGTRNEAQSIVRKGKRVLTTENLNVGASWWRLGGFSFLTTVNCQDFQVLCFSGTSPTL